MNGPLSGLFGSPKIFENWVQFEIRIGVLTGPPGASPTNAAIEVLDALDRLVRGGDLLDIDAWRQVRGHVTPYSVYDSCPIRRGALHDRDGDEAVLGARIEDLHHVLLAVPEDDLGLGGGPRTRERAHATYRVQVQHHDVGPQPVRRADDGAGPVLLSDHLGPSSLRRRAIPMTMIGPRFPSRTRGAAHRCPPRQNLRFLPPCERESEGSRSGNPCLALIPFSRGPLAARPVRGRPRHRARLPCHGLLARRGPRHDAMLAWRQRSKMKRPSRSVDAKRPRSGSVTHDVGQRLAVLVADAARRSAAAPRRARAGRPRAELHRLGADLGAAREGERRTRPRASPRSRSRPCSARRSGPEVGLLLLAAGRPRSRSRAAGWRARGGP